MKQCVFFRHETGTINFAVTQVLKLPARLGSTPPTKQNAPRGGPLLTSSLGPNKRITEKYGNTQPDHKSLQSRMTWLLTAHILSRCSKQEKRHEKFQGIERYKKEKS